MQKALEKSRAAADAQRSKRKEAEVEAASRLDIANSRIENLAAVLDQSNEALEQERVGKVALSQASGSAQHGTA